MLIVYKRLPTFCNLNKKPILEEDVEIAYKPIADISNKISNFINKNDFTPNKTR